MHNWPLQFFNLTFMDPLE